jgi:hypothetical protein
VALTGLAALLPLARLLVVIVLRSMVYPFEEITSAQNGEKCSP